MRGRRHNKSKVRACSADMLPSAVADRNKECLQSLAFPEMNVRGNDIKDQAPETCGWLLKHKNYKAWLGQHQGLLWIKGKPGAGKSTLLRYALQNAKQQASRNKEVIASFFFHGRGAPIQKNPLGLFRSLLHQLLDQLPDMLAELTLVYEKKCKTEGALGKEWEWHVTELQNFLQTTVPRVSTVHPMRIYVDALDECDGGEDVARELVAFFQRLTSPLAPAEVRLSMCFSCRYYSIVYLPRGLTICVEHDNGQDIETYVEDKFQPVGMV